MSTSSPQDWEGETSILSLFQELKDLNFKPDSSTYSIAIICYVEDEDIKEACVRHNKIIEMLSLKIGEIDAAMMLVRDCLGNVTSGPMAFKYTLTILHACKSGAEKVMEVLNEMMQEGLPPDNIICSAIISGMCKYGTIEEARKVFANLRTLKLLTEANTTCMMKY
ncbi:hypothetical protein CRYUN_Cryun41cG0000300 [Craigia yunnanensis]